MKILQKSWTQNWFLKINALSGRYKIFDRLMIFSAHYLIYFLGIFVFVWGTYGLFLESPMLLNRLLKLLLTAIVLAEILSYSTAFVWRHPRPIIECPGIKCLMHTMETWKSFPSDHTIISFSFAFIAILLGAPVWFGIVLFCMACFVAFARIWVGVHYPRDIFGGIIIAAVFSFSAPWLLVYVTQPLYIFCISIFL